MNRPLLYYIRHGETDWNVEGRLQGRHDTTLNAVGRRQAGACADILRDLLARGVTGEIHHVDAGYHVVGMKHPDAPDIAVGKD